jgi:hypothetical protein
VKAARIPRTLVSLALFGAFGSGLVNCADEPKPTCLVSPAGFAARLVVKSMEESTAGACDTFGPSGFNVDPEVGLAPFYAQDAKGNSDYLKGSLAVQTAEVGTYLGNALGAGLTNTATDPSVYSIGPFASARPDDNDFCTIPTLTKTHVVLGDVPAVPDDPSTPDDDESVPEQLPQDITLEWSNIKVYVTAGNYGTQFAADLIDTRVTPEGETCTYTYHVLGLSPAVPCSEHNFDDGTPADDCSPFADEAHDVPVGSGIAPNVSYQCDADTAFCAIKGDSIPALK